MLKLRRTHQLVIIFICFFSFAFGIVSSMLSSSSDVCGGSSEYFVPYMIMEVDEEHWP